MKRKIFFLTIIAAFAIILSFIEIKEVRNKFSGENCYEVLAATNSLNCGDSVNEDDIKYIKILGEADTKYFLKGEELELRGMVSDKDIEAGEILLKKNFCELEEMNIADDNNILVTFEMTAPEANGWNVREGQLIDIIFCPKDTGQFKYKIYKSIKIRGYYDSELSQLDYAGRGRAKYVTVEINKMEGYELICNKEYGRIELIVI